MREQLILSRKTITNFLVPFPSIVTSKDCDGKSNALTLSYFSAIHWDPPSVLMSISSKHKSSRNLKENPIFTINILENDVQSVELAYLVGTRSGNQKEIFVEESFQEDLNVFESQEWPPIVQGSIIALHGVIVQQTEYFGQILYIGEIKEARILESLQIIDLNKRSSMWKALDEIVMKHSDIYSNI